MEYAATLYRNWIDGVCAANQCGASFTYSLEIPLRVHEDRDVAAADTLERWKKVCFKEREAECIGSEQRKFPWRSVKYRRNGYVSLCLNFAHRRFALFARN